jgi:hypothetical protein
MSPDRCRIFEVDAFGEFRRSSVVVSLGEAPRPSTAELDELIEQAWRRATVECRERGAILFNGRLVRWIGHRAEAGVLHVDAGMTDYRECVGTNFHNAHRIGEFGRAAFSNPIGTTATVVTSDGWLVYGRRSHRVAWHAGHLHTFGGALEGADIRPDGVVDIFDAITRELGEEIRVGPDEIDDLVCLGLLHDFEIWQPELILDAHVRLTHEELLARFDRDEAEQEHASIECVRDEPDALLPFIRSSAPIAPVCVGAICLHGRRRFGEEWYASLLPQL